MSPKSPHGHSRPRLDAASNPALAAGRKFPFFAQFRETRIVRAVQDEQIVQRPLPPGPSLRMCSIMAQTPLDRISYGEQARNVASLASGGDRQSISAGIGSGTCSPPGTEARADRRQDDHSGTSPEWLSALGLTLRCSRSASREIVDSGFTPALLFGYVYGPSTPELEKNAVVPLVL